MVLRRPRLAQFERIALTKWPRKKDVWTTFPIPLNCFTKEGLDIKKVSGPVNISTEGRLGLTITNIRLQKLPEGEKGCAK